MKTLALATALLLLLPTFAYPQPATVKVPCIDVVDGDTIKVIYQGESESVRLIGVDAPEREVPRYADAKDFVIRMAEGDTIYLEFDTPLQDRYGRLLAYVYLGDGTMVNEELIRHGYSHPYTKYPFKYEEQFRKIESIKNIKESLSNSKSPWWWEITINAIPIMVATLIGVFVGGRISRRTLVGIERRNIEREERQVRERRARLLTALLREIDQIRDRAEIFIRERINNRISFSYFLTPVFDNIWSEYQGISRAIELDSKIYELYERCKYANRNYSKFEEYDTAIKTQQLPNPKYVIELSHQRIGTFIYFAGRTLSVIYGIFNSVIEEIYYNNPEMERNLENMFVTIDDNYIKERIAEFKMTLADSDGNPQKDESGDKIVVELVSLEEIESKFLGRQLSD